MTTTSTIKKIHEGKMKVSACNYMNITLRISTMRTHFDKNKMFKALCTPWT